MAETETHEQQPPEATGPVGWYPGPQWPGERYFDGAQWTDAYRQPDWITVKLKGPFVWGGAAYAFPLICCACGSPAGAGTLAKGNTDAGHAVASYSFALCDRCAWIQSLRSPRLFSRGEEKEEPNRRRDEWERVDDAVTFTLDSRGQKATFRFRNRQFAEAFALLNREQPKPAAH